MKHTYIYTPTYSRRSNPSTSMLRSGDISINNVREHPWCVLFEMDIFGLAAEKHPHGMMQHMLSPCLVFVIAVLFSLRLRPKAMLVRNIARIGRRNTSFGVMGNGFSGFP
jgi:hypothetical protein